MAGAAVKSLQQRLDESKRSEKEKDAAVARLKSHARQLEELVQKARREGDEKDSKREREYKMLQDVSPDVWPSNVLHLLIHYFREADDVPDILITKITCLSKETA